MRWGPTIEDVRIALALVVAAFGLPLVLACSGGASSGGPEDAASGTDGSLSSDAKSTPDAADAGSPIDAIADATDASDGASTDSGDASDALAPLPADEPIGVDMPDLLRIYLGLAPGGASAAQHQMDLARSRGFTHARFEASQFWPAELQGPDGWRSNPAGYFAAFDALMADARARGLRLVPSLLWQSFLFPDAAGEPRGKLFVPGSASRTLAEQYITQVVTRYQADDGVLFWEVGNEFNLSADVDYAGCVGSNLPDWCCVAPSLGSPASRTSADDYVSCNACLGISSTQQDLGEFMAAMATLIHGIDPGRSISSGYSVMVPNAWHAARTSCPPCDYTEDTPAQYDQMLGLLHPAGIDVVSAHHYPGADTVRFGDTDPSGAALLAHTMSVTSGLGKKLFVGEWGEPSAGSTTCSGVTDTCGGDASKSFSLRVLDALTASEVPFSGLWAYEDYPACAGVPSCYTVLDSDPLVAAMVTHASAYGSCAGKPDATACPIGACQSQKCVSTTPPPTPTTLHAYTFQAASDTSGWTVFTNCTGCVPGTFGITGTAPAAYVELTSNDLTCSGSCSYPGSYAVSPSLPVGGSAIVVLRFSARASVASGAVVSITAFDGTGVQHAQDDVAVQIGTSFATGGGALQVPASTASVNVRVALLTPNATLDLDGLTVFSQP